MSDLPDWVKQGAKCICVRDTPWNCDAIVAKNPQPQFMYQYTVGNKIREHPFALFGIGNTWSINLAELNIDNMFMLIDLGTNRPNFAPVEDIIDQVHDEIVIRSRGKILEHVR